MPLPKHSDKANLALIQGLVQAQPLDQQKLLKSWLNGGNKHQLALVFEFPPGFKLNLTQVQQDTAYGERVMRLCESVNQPDTIKADIWTHTPNGGTLSGLQPGVACLGTPMSPENFLGQIKYVLIAYIRPGNHPKSLTKNGTVANEVEELVPTFGIETDPVTGQKKAVKKKPTAFISEELLNSVKSQKMGDVLNNPSLTNMSYEQYLASQKAGPMGLDVVVSKDVPANQLYVMDPN